MQWNDYDVYISGFLHWLCTNSQKNIGYASLTERTLTILQMVNTRRGAEPARCGKQSSATFADPGRSRCPADTDSAYAGIESIEPIATPGQTSAAPGCLLQ